MTEDGGGLTGLENSLEEAKAMNKRKNNMDVGLFEDVDGTRWPATEGCGALTGLENRLEDLKNMYKRKHGSEGLFENADGTKWQVIEGHGATAR